MVVATLPRQSRDRLGTGVSLTYRQNEDARYENIVARKAKEIGLDVTARSVKAFRGIERAPKTRERITSGDIKRIGDVKPAIDAELRRNLIQTEWPVERPLTPDRTVNTQLGQVLKALTDIANDAEKDIGKMPAQISERWDAIKRIIPDVEKMLRRRGLI